MSALSLPKPYFVESRHLGQIGAGKVVPFVCRGDKKWIPLPKGAKTFDQYTEYEICGDSLIELGILDGYILTCRTNFEASEVKPNRVFIVEILTTNEQLAKMVRVNNDGTVTLASANPRHKPMVFFANEIRLLAMAVEVRWQI